MQSLYKTLTKIHRQRKRQLVPTDDLEAHGTVEDWPNPADIPPADANVKVRDDCDWFAVACWVDCMAMGLDANLALCTVDGGGHLVCECQGWIVCNLQTFVASRNSLDYEWRKIGRPDEEWYIIVK